MAPLVDNTACEVALAVKMRDAEMQKVRSEQGAGTSDGRTSRPHFPVRNFFSCQAARVDELKKHAVIQSEAQNAPWR
jgi:hypothetical protein